MSNNQYSADRKNFIENLILDIDILKKNNNVKDLKQKEIVKCWAILNFITKAHKDNYEWIKGDTLKYHLKMNGQELRDYILMIRREMITKFQNPTANMFLVGSNKGYRLTNNKQEIEIYFAKVKKRWVNLTLQKKQLILGLFNFWPKK